VKAGDSFLVTTELMVDAADAVQRRRLTVRVTNFLLQADGLDAAGKRLLELAALTVQPAEGIRLPPTQLTSVADGMRQPPG
jgi:hypothetical protein